MAFEASALQAAFHADQRVLAEPCRTLLRRDHHKAHPQGQLLQRRRFGDRHLRRDCHLDRASWRMGLAPDDRALCPSVRGCRGRGCFPDRLRNARSDHDPVGSSNLSGGAGVSRSGNGGAVDPRRWVQDRLCGRLVGIFLASPCGRVGRRVLPPRPALGRQRRRFHRHR